MNKAIYRITKHYLYMHQTMKKDYTEMSLNNKITRLKVKIQYLWDKVVKNLPYEFQLSYY